MANTELKDKFSRYELAIEILTDLSEKDNESPQLQPIIIYLKEKKSNIAKAVIEKEAVFNHQVDSAEIISPNS